MYIAAVGASTTEPMPRIISGHSAAANFTRRMNTSRSEIAAVGELESADAALVTGLHDLLGHVGVGMIEYGNHAGLTDGLQNLHFLKNEP